MARGRKKIENPKCENITIRVTKAQKEVMKKNDWIKKEVNDIVRNYLNTYL